MVTYVYFNKIYYYITICYKYFNYQTFLNYNDNIKLILSLLINRFSTKNFEFQ